MQDGWQCRKPTNLFKQELLYVVCPRCQQKRQPSGTRLLGADVIRDGLFVHQAHSRHSRSTRRHSGTAIVTDDPEGVPTGGVLARLDRASPLTFFLHSRIVNPQWPRHLEKLISPTPQTS